jgi:hypothetical protein
MVQAAAVAAGARIAPASAAASLLKAAQSGNVVHIGIGGVSLAKTTMPNQQTSIASANNVKLGAASGSRTPNGASVHYIRTGGTGSPQSLPIVGQRAPPLKAQTMGRTISSQMTTQVQLTQRPSPITLSQSVVSTSSAFMPQKSQLSSVTPAPTMKAKSTGLPTDSCMIVINDSVNEGGVKPADCKPADCTAQEWNAVGDTLVPLSNSVSESLPKRSTEDNQAPGGTPALNTGNKAEVAVFPVESPSINTPSIATGGHEALSATTNDSTKVSTEKAL